MYKLKTSDGKHTLLGQSIGNRQDEDDGTYWITGWSDETRRYVAVDGSYLLQLDGRKSFTSVRVTEIGGPGMGGICFENNTEN